MLRFEGHGSTELNGEGKLSCPEAGRPGCSVSSGGLSSPEPAPGLSLGQPKDTLKAFKGLHLYFHFYLDR